MRPSPCSMQGSCRVWGESMGSSCCNVEEEGVGAHTGTHYACALEWVGVVESMPHASYYYGSKGMQPLLEPPVGCGVP